MHAKSVSSDVRSEARKVKKDSQRPSVPFIGAGFKSGFEHAQHRRGDVFDVYVVRKVGSGAPGAGEADPSVPVQKDAQPHLGLMDACAA